MSNENNETAQNVEVSGEVQETQETPSFTSQEDFGKYVADQKKVMEQLQAKINELTKPKPAKQDEEKVTYAKRVEALENQLKAEREEKLASAASNRTREVLTENNIAPSLMKAAMSVLKEDGKVKYNDSGELVFIDQYGLEKDLKSGLKEWSNSGEGKVFQSAKNVKGSGDRPQSVSKSTDKVSVKDIQDGVLDYFRGNLK